MNSSPKMTSNGTSGGPMRKSESHVSSDLVSSAHHVARTILSDFQSSPVKVVQWAGASSESRASCFTTDGEIQFSGVPVSSFAFKFIHSLVFPEHILMRSWTLWLWPRVLPYGFLLTQGIRRFCLTCLMLWSGCCLELVIYWAQTSRSEDFLTCFCCCCSIQSFLVSNVYRQSKMIVVWLLTIRSCQVDFVQLLVCDTPWVRHCPNAAWRLLKQWFTQRSSLDNFNDLLCDSHHGSSYVDTGRALRSCGCGSVDLRDRPVVDGKLEAAHRLGDIMSAWALREFSNDIVK